MKLALYAGACTTPHGGGRGEIRPSTDLVVEVYVCVAEGLLQVGHLLLGRA